MIERIKFETMQKYYDNEDHYDNKNNIHMQIIGYLYSKEQIKIFKRKGYFKILKEVVLNAEKKIGTIQFACGEIDNNKRLLFRGKESKELDHILCVMKFIDKYHNDKILNKDEIINANEIIISGGEVTGTDSSCPLF